MCSERVPKRLVVCNQKGGCGKTTTARNLAAIAAGYNLKVCTVDLDGQLSLTSWIEKRPGEANEITNFQADMNEVEAIREIVGFDVCVIDTPPLVVKGADANEVRNAERMRNLHQLLLLADYVLVPTLQNSEDVQSTESWMRLLKELNIKSASLLSATSRRTLSFEHAKRRLSKCGELVPLDIPRFEDIPASNNLGLSVAEIKKAKGSDDFIAVWDFVSMRLGLEKA